MYLMIKPWSSCKRFALNGRSFSSKLHISFNRVTHLSLINSRIKGEKGGRSTNLSAFMVNTRRWKVENVETKTVEKEKLLYPDNIFPAVVDG